MACEPIQSPDDLTTETLVEMLADYGRMMARGFAEKYPFFDQHVAREMLVSNIGSITAVFWLFTEWAASVMQRRECVA